jgi:hypothetical protein
VYFTKIVKFIVDLCDRDDMLLAVTMTNEIIFKQTLETAKDEMARLLRERKEIDDRLSKLAPLVEYLSMLCAVRPADAPVPSVLDLGLSDAIRLVFKSAPSRFGLTAIEVRDQLREQGFHLDKYANELPPIHNTIARLEKAGEIELITRPDGAKAHRWVSSLKRLIDEIEHPNTVPLSSLLRADSAVEAAIKALGFGQPDDLPQASKGKTGLPPPPPPTGSSKERK